MDNTLKLVLVIGTTFIGLLTLAGIQDYRDRKSAPCSDFASYAVQNIPFRCLSIH